jgi:predicted DNA-binding transcriptional regulator AlpA
MRMGAMKESTATVDELLHGGHPLWTAEETGRVIKLSGKSVYRLADKDASFPRVKIGGTLRFPREKVLRWIEQRTQGAAELRSPRKPRVA